MNTAWYGHLKFKSTPIFLAILASWGVAFLEYCLQVPANRLGSDVMSVTQLKVIQEVLSIGTFALFAWLAFKERPTLNQYVAFALIVVAAYLAAKR
ncbi:MAG: DMT family protein [Fimbriimonas ginsengisoli]|uniref:DMT family protein n=1 Tax=Fimbriimonas ginsengisoli TaxID=1005039 RepID=A0A931LT16_FIMGI|nr:DMT family protein [Fimbriimonas ginsengisoli]